MKWFRFYVDTINDIKIRRLPPSQRWLWVAVLSLARMSPKPGTLILSEGGSDVTVTSQDLADASHIPLEDAKEGVEAFLRMNMLRKDEQGAFVVTHWDKRQFSSDDGSKERTKQYRERKKTKSVTSQESHSDSDCDVTATVPDTDTDTDTDTDLNMYVKKDAVNKILASYFQFGINEDVRYDIVQLMDKGLELELLNVAYQLSVECDARSKPKFIKSTLQNFLNDGVTTVAQYETREAQRQAAAGGAKHESSGHRRTSTDFDEPDPNSVEAFLRSRGAS